MKSLDVEIVELPREYDLDNGEGRLSFRWADPLYGHQGLTIADDGFCSREMPIRSGIGPPDEMELRRDCLRLRFSPGLAKKLELAEEIELHFTLPDEQFGLLERTIESLRSFL